MEPYRKAILLFLLVFGAALLVLLYYQRYYDFSFLERYKSRLDLLRAGEPLSSANDDPFAVPDVLLNNPTGDLSSSSPADPGQAEQQADDPSDAAGTGSPEGSAGSAGAVSEEPPEPPDNLRFVYDTGILPDAREKVPSVSELLEAGKTFAS